LETNWLAFALAAVFALFTGFNDAGTLIGLGLRLGLPGLRPGVAVLLLTACVAAAPVLLGTAVAATLGERLVGFDGDSLPVAAGVIAAVLVTAVLAARGLPTSLTLALIGGIAGAGLGADLAVDWKVVGAVLVAAALAPCIGGIVALGLSRIVGLLPAPEGAGLRLRRLHAGALGVTCLAYGVNDGQKMLAVYAAVQGGAVARYSGSPLAIATISGCFLIGALAGLPRLAGALAGGLSTGRADTAVITELSGATVVIGTAAAGAPVSMTQSLSGAMVGAGLSRRARKVRWPAVLRLGSAWMLTLPTAFAAGAIGCLTLAAVR
jgi:inorganic phosphate transporter, PiT family